MHFAESALHNENRHQFFEEAFEIQPQSLAKRWAPFSKVEEKAESENHKTEKRKGLSMTK